MAEEQGTSFGDLLRHYRALAGLSQVALASRTGISKEAVSMLERGVRSRPRNATVLRLAQALRLRPEERTALAAAARRASSKPAAGAVPPESGAGIPPDPIPHFVGREPELEELHRELLARRRVAVYGLGGIGKTQLAVQYLHRRRGEYPDGVFWLRAEQEASLVGDPASLAWRLRLPERETRQQERQIEAVLVWLRAHERWLLVLDNVAATSMEAVRRWLSPGLPGHLLVTSRTPMWSARVGLEPLPSDVAGRFLLDRTGEADAAAALAVAEALGCLPLALEQAAAYLEVSGRDLAGYARLLRTRLPQLMREGKPDDYPRPVASTWLISFERVARDRPPAAALLRLCAFLAPDDIPISALRAGAGQLPEELRRALSDELELDRTTGVLTRYSLAHRQADVLRVHRLVQAVIRDALGPDQRRWLSAAVRLLHTVMPEEPQLQPALWPLCARLVAHIHVANELGGAGTDEAEAMGALLNRLGSYLRCRGDFDRARPAYERALSIREATLGADHPVTADSLSDLAGLLRERGELAAARPLHERALAIRERTLGRDHLDTSNSLNNLGFLLRDQGDLGGARSLLERALAIRERVLGAEHQGTATILNNLALVLIDECDLAAARPLLDRALAIRERTLGLDHNLTAECLSNLGHLLTLQGELAAARPLLERSVAMLRRILGPGHPHTARVEQRLAVLLQARGQLAAARDLHANALATLERTLGPKHQFTIEGSRALQAVVRELQQQASQAQ
ncbi:MAG TPA: helix-turn-helix transcriptional regulator [Candidatus Dormibacteraeota bacterium]|nr:helix-turn-helix transcriptional regulator [Candidatus Dormibacteraeota bacterium]